MPVVGASAFPYVSDVTNLVRSLLADLDYPSQSYLAAAPTGASRTSNVSTFTTTSVHGLVPGDTVQVAGVTDSTFSGTFAVLTVPTTTTFTVANAGSDGTSGNGYVDTISQGDVYSDTVLMPLVNSAYRKVQRKLLDAGSPTMTAFTTYTALAVDTETLSDTTDPQLPDDFLAPRMLWEKPTGTVDINYRILAAVDNIESTPQLGFNYQYSWSGEAIYLPGATQVLDLKMRYFRSLASVSDGSAQILIRGSADALAYYTAALASNSRSSPQAATFQALADQHILELCDMQAHSGQYRPRRRRPYGGRGGTGGSVGFGGFFY